MLFILPCFWHWLGEDCLYVWAYVSVGFMSKSIVTALSYLCILSDRWYRKFILNYKVKKLFSQNYFHRFLFFFLLNRKLWIARITWRWMNYYCHFSVSLFSKSSSRVIIKAIWNGFHFNDLFVGITLLQHKWSLPGEDISHQQFPEISVT